MAPIFLLEDDWELRGNGLGDVAQLQYLPALFLMGLCRELDIRCTFMVEVMQQLAFERSVNQRRDLNSQIELWKETVFRMIDEGHDVQLHIHPQWHNAVLRDGYFCHEGSWNIADYPEHEQESIIRKAHAYLSGVRSQAGLSEPLIAFKAGAWAIQPATVPLRILRAHGIQVLMAPGRACRYRVPGFVADYSAIQEDTLPYVADPDVIENVGPDGGVVVLPMPYYRRGGVRTAYRVTNRVVDRLFGKDNSAGDPVLAKDASAPAFVKASAPNIGETRSLRAGLRASMAGAPIMFDIAQGDADELLFGLRQIVSRMNDAGGNAPIVLQSHTKGYIGNWKNLTRFYRGLRDLYPDAQCLTVTDYWRDHRTFLLRQNEAGE